MEGGVMIVLVIPVIVVLIVIVTTRMMCIMMVGRALVSYRWSHWVPPTRVRWDECVYDSYLLLRIERYE